MRVGIGRPVHCRSPARSGISNLLHSLKRQGEPVQFVVLDLGGLTTVAGYNVYRIGEKRYAEMLYTPLL
jgi:hypothetical protein